MSDEAAKTAALEHRIDALEKAVVAIGALIADQLGGEGTGPRNKVRQNAEALAQTYADVGQPEIARLLRAFRVATNEPWSFFAWLDKRSS